MTCAVMLCLASGVARGGYFEHCVYYGRVAEIPGAGAAADAVVKVEVSRALALRGSHKRCRDNEGNTLSARLSASGLRVGTWLLLRHERSRGLCESGRACGSDDWHVLYQEDRSR